MLQIGALFAAIIALVMGGNAFTKGEVEITKTAKLTGTGARVLGAVLIVVGLAFAALGIIILPWMLAASR